MGLIEYIFKIPEKIFMTFFSMIWFIISKVLTNLWDNHMVSIWDYTNMWHNFLSYIPRLIKGTIESMKNKPTWKSRFYNLFKTGILSGFNPNPPDPKIPLLMEGAFYFCHIIVFIGFIVLITKIHKFVSKFKK